MGFGLGDPSTSNRQMVDRAKVWSVNPSIAKFTWVGVVGMERSVEKCWADLVCVVQIMFSMSSVRLGLGFVVLVCAMFWMPRKVFFINGGDTLLANGKLK